MRTRYQLDRDVTAPRTARDVVEAMVAVAELSDAWGVSGDGGTCAWALRDRTKAPRSLALA